VGRERQLAKIPGDLTLFDVGADGRALVGREDWRGECYGFSDGAIEERNLSWFDFSVPSDLSHDGKILLFFEFGEAGGSNLASYLRRMDASPPVRVADGMCQTISRDGETLICNSAAPGQLIQVPTKTGEPTPFLQDQLNHINLKLFPDEKRIVSLAFEAGHGTRLYVQDAGGGQPRGITPEGANDEYAVSPDGREVAGTIGSEYEGFLFPANGGEPHHIPGFKPGDLPIGWSEDNQFLYAHRLEDLPARVYQIELATGSRKVWKQLMPPDPTGVIFIDPILLAADRKSYAYGLNRKLHDLYLVEGLK
jgi:eukaryotic-like serine/threonine-protein kinase